MICVLADALVLVIGLILPLSPIIAYVWARCGNEIAAAREQRKRAKQNRPHPLFKN